MPEFFSYQKCECVISVGEYVFVFVSFCDYVWEISGYV